MEPSNTTGVHSERAPLKYIRDGMLKGNSAAQEVWLLAVCGLQYFIVSDKLLLNNLI